MAADIIVGAFFSSLFQTLFDKLSSPLYRNLFQGLKVDDRLLKDLRIMMLSAYQLLDDAEDKQIQYPAVREWLFELKEAIDDAEHMLDRINFEALRYKQESKPESSRSKRLKLTISTFFNTFDKEIGEIRDRLDRLVKQKDVLSLKGVKDRPLQRLPAPLVDESCVYGRDGDKEHIIELLLSDDPSGDKISVVSIVGMGGIGKTTVAQLVYDDNKVRNHFDLKAWVTVSDEFDISKITKQIIEQAAWKKCESEHSGLNQMQYELREALRGRRFLLVLDDVWNQSYDSWDVLQSPFQSGAQGSKIIVTTRYGAIAKMMGVKTHYLQLVSDDDGWRLFVKHAFKNASFDSYPNLLAIGKEIVTKCKGLPLAIKSIAGLLCTMLDPEEWKRVLKNDVWESQSQILPSLWLSYHYLPLHLKRCFAYCSIFPKDYEIGKSEREKLILLWMAEGLLQPDRKGKRLEDIGDDYFKDLTSRSLFQQSSMDASTYFMHDLVHNLAVYVSGDFCLRLEAGSKTLFSSKTRHFSCSKFVDLESFGGISAAKNLHTCIKYTSYVGPLSSVFLSSLLLQVGRSLRAICLSGSSLTVLPGLIGDLKHLRYLDLSNNGFEKLPDTLCGLYNLQTLRLTNCHKLSKLPTDMGNLVNLRHLDVDGVPLEEMPPEIGNMKDLQTLSKFVVGKNKSSSIKQLRGLSCLYGDLEILGLNNVDYDGDALEANLEDKNCLDYMKMSWEVLCDSADDLQKDKDRKVLDALKPHKNLKRLHISTYGGTTFPNWVGHHSYVNTVSVCLINCGNCCSLPPLGQLYSLQFLVIHGCSVVVKIGDEFYGSSSSKVEPFRSLKFLKFECMLELREWSFSQGQKGGCFPRLEYLWIENCPKLEMCLPDDFPRHMDQFFPSLKLLNTVDCPRLENSFLSGNLPLNLRKLYIYGLDPPNLEEEEARLDLSITENVMTLPDALPWTTPTFLAISMRHSDLKAINGRGFQHLTSLEDLQIKDCLELQCLPGETLPISLTSLRVQNVPKLKHFGKGFRHLSSLEELCIKDCKEIQCLPGETLPTSLTSLHIEDVPKLKHLGKGLQHLSSLEKLRIKDCKELRRLPGEMLPKSLTSLRIKDVPKLKHLGKGFQHLHSLEELHIKDCKELQHLSGETLPTSLISLRIKDIPKLKHLGKGFQHLSSLEELRIKDCKDFQHLGKGFQHLTSLKKLCISDGENLQAFPVEWWPTSLTCLHIAWIPNLRDLGNSFHHLVALTELKICFCDNLRSLPAEGLPPSLSFLRILGCPFLEPRCQRDTGEDWSKIAHIPHKEIWEYEDKNNITVLKKVVFT